MVTSSTVIMKVKNAPSMFLARRISLVRVLTFSGEKDNESFHRFFSFIFLFFEVLLGLTDHSSHWQTFGFWFYMFLVSLKINE